MKKLGLCLSGGGARGAYQIGVLSYLEEIGLYEKIKVFSGTSIGAANVAVLRSTSLEHVKDIWLHIPEEPLVKKYDESLLNRLKKDGLKILDEGYYSMEKFDNMMLSQIDVEKLRNDEIYITVADHDELQKGIKEVLATSLSRMFKQEHASYVALHNLNFTEAFYTVKASCSIPFFFDPVLMHSAKAYDGGIYDNAPIKPLIDAGCDEIILINITMIPKTLGQKKRYPGVRVHELQHMGYLGGILDFSTEHSKKLFEMGYQDALRYFTKHKI